MQWLLHVRILPVISVLRHIAHTLTYHRLKVYRRMLYYLQGPEALCRGIDLYVGYATAARCCLRHQLYHQCFFQ